MHAVYTSEMAVKSAIPGDLDEDEALRRYLGMRRLSEIVRDAERRADAQRRLEYALRIATR